MKHFFNFIKNFNYNSINGGYKLILIILFLFLKPLTFICTLLFYIIFILFFLFYLYNNKFRRITNKPEYMSIIKDKEFILFKNNLFNLYFYSILILFIFIFKHYSINFFLNLNNYYFLISIFLFYLILSSNLFTLNLFNFLKKIKIYIKILNELDLGSFIESSHKFYSYTKFYFTPAQSRSFSTTSNLNNNLNNNSDPFEYDPELENMTSSQLVELLPTDTKFRNKYLAYERNKSLKEFQKIYKGGYLGYRDIHHLGNVSNLVDLSDPAALSYWRTLTAKLNEYLNEIPENVVYSVLPVLR